MSNVVDVSELKKLDDKLAELDASAKDKILYSSLMKGAKILFEATKVSLIQKMGDAATRPIRKPKGRGDGTYKPLITGISIGGDKPYCEVKVHIMGGGQGYLRWFEKGTNIRQTSKGYNRGSIKGLNFFFAAKQANLTRITETITSNIDKQINKIMN